MSIASRYGKLRISAEDDGTRARRQEDLLTADVFGAYRYLPAELGLRSLLAHAVSVDGEPLRRWAEARDVPWNELSLIKCAFWPCLASKEPDLVIVLGDTIDPARLAILVEVKLHAEQHTIDGASQLGFYGAALLDDRLEGEPFDVALPPLRPVVLLTKERTVPSAALARARSELGDHHAEGRTDAFWVSWTTAAILATEALEARKREGAPAHELAVLEDLVADLEERGFRPPRTLTSLPMPALAPLPTALRGWANRPAPPRGRRLTDLAGASLAPIDDALRHWGFR